MGGHGLNWMWLRTGTNVGSFGHGNGLSDGMKFGDFLRSCHAVRFSRRALLHAVI
jgi:hypothetical protein